MKILFFVYLIFNLYICEGQTIIYVNDDASGLNNGSSWSNAFNDLQKALEQAKKGDQIWVAKGTYYPSVSPDSTKNNPRNFSFTMINNVKLYGGFKGTERKLKHRSLSQKYRSILSGDIKKDKNKNNNCYHVVTSISNNNKTILDGFMIQHGNANGSNEIKYRKHLISQSQGGGVYIGNSSIIVSNCIISNNNANVGSGILSIMSKPSIINTKIYRNKSTSFGAGLFNFFSTPILTDCLIKNNSASITGGGIFNHNSSPHINSCKIYGNYALTGESDIHNQDKKSKPVIKK